MSTSPEISEETTSVRMTRITSSFCNHSKVKKFQDVDRFVLGLKNRMSDYIRKNLQWLMDDKKEFIRTYNKFNSKVILAWETQTIFHDIVGLYDNRIAQLRTKVDTSVQYGIKVTHYKRQTTLKNGVIAKKGSVKEYRIRKKYTEIGRVVKLLTFLDTDNLEKYSKSKFYPLILHWMQSKHWDRIVKLSKSINTRLFSKIEVIEFTTGTYRINLKGTEFIVDESNAKFKNWFKYGKTFYPLSINQEYHGDLSKLKTEKNKQVTVKVVDDNVHFLFTKDYTPQFKEQMNVVGVDINIKHNFCTTSGREKFDYDRTYITEFIDEIKKLDAIGYKNISNDQKKHLNRIIGKNEWYFKKLISEVLDSFEKQGYTDIVMEDFDNNSFKSSFVSSDEFKEKYTRLIRLLRLGNIKKWMLEQGEKRGMRVHTTPAPYTSQECPCCHHIDADNRKTQEEFKCVECGFEDEADFVSPVNIKNRFHSNVLREMFHKVDDYGRLTPKKVNREKLKESLSSFYTSVTKVDSTFDKLITNNN